MAEFVKGDVVVVAFPFSDLSQSKKRPALVLSEPMGEDVVLCQITSKASKDKHAVDLSALDFSKGGLPVDSYVRANKLFTAHQSLILSTAGHVTPEKYSAIIEKITNIIS